MWGSRFLIKLTLSLVLTAIRRLPNFPPKLDKETPSDPH